MKHQSMVQRAADEFKQGNFRRALDLYRRLADQLGEKNFHANIWLCEKRLRRQSHLNEANQSLRSTRVACVMDEFTFHCFEPECELLALTPGDAINELEDFEPNLLFIESAWRGKDDLWTRKIGALSQELRGVLRWCKEHRVPTVFWNKEDPVHFETFLTTAQEFDFVFTTDIDCIARYKAALGHEHVYLLPFACQPKIHNPIEHYERKDAFCFAGAYYVRYPERTRDLENYVEQLPEYKPLEIFDRNFGKEDDNYRFPPKYQPYIVGTLPFNEIDKAYKGYRYSVNLNSIKQSQTMFARRVYELLGSNTITVSNFSRGLRLLFGDLVISSDDGAEVVSRLKQMGREGEQKHRLAALRKVMEEHTYHHRLAYVVHKATGRRLEKSLPLMVVVALVGTSQEVRLAFENYNAQRYVSKRLLIVAKEDSLLQTQQLAHGAEKSVKVVSEKVVAESSIEDLLGEEGWIVEMATSDYYGPNYLLDLALATHYCDTQLIGKAERYQRESGETRLANSGLAYHATTDFTRHASAIWWRAVPHGSALLTGFDEGSETKWHLPGMAIDPFNYCQNGRLAENLAEIAQRVDDLSLDSGLSIGELIRDAEGIGAIDYDESALPRWSASKLLQVLGIIKHEEIKVELRAGNLCVESRLADSQHKYIYASNDLPVSALPVDGTIKSHLEVTPGLEIQYVFLFFNNHKERLSHVIHTSNRNQTEVLPATAMFFRIGIRISGGGNAKIKCLLWGHRKLELARLFGSSDKLLLTNHYPSYDNLYRNGFVHSRVKSYLDRRVQVEIFRLHQVEVTSFHEFENVDVVTGNQGALRTLLESGRHKHILVHFLTPEMWDVLQRFNQTRITVWIHGSEIQPWHRRDYNYQNDQERAKAIRESELRMAFWRSLLQPMPANLNLVFVSRYFAEEVFEDLGFRVPESRYEIIHNPIDTDLFNYQRKPVEQRKRVLSIRPYASRKYANDLSVKAILKLAEQPCFADMEFRMIGDGKLFDETLEPLRKFPNVTIERRFLTHPEIAAIHKEYGVCLMPTRMDAQGVSRDEAMSSGLVPITSAVAAVPEFVDHSCGILAEAEDADGLAAGMMAIYESPSRFATLSSAASDRVKQQSSAHVVVRKELALFSRKGSQ